MRLCQLVIISCVFFYNHLDRSEISADVCIRFHQNFLHVQTSHTFLLHLGGNKKDTTLKVAQTLTTLIK